MEVLRIYQLEHLPRKLLERLREAQMEAARVWMLCRDLHLHARQNRIRWPNSADLEKAAKGKFALYSQTVQKIYHIFYGNVESTRKVRKQNPRIHYSYKDKRFYCERHGTEITVINGGSFSPEEELVRDLIAIVTVFSARLHGLRPHKNAIRAAALPGTGGKEIRDDQSPQDTP